MCSTPAKFLASKPPAAAASATPSNATPQRVLNDVRNGYVTQRARAKFIASRSTARMAISSSIKQQTRAIARAGSRHEARGLKHE